MAGGAKEKPSSVEEAQQKWADDDRDERLRMELREMNQRVAAGGVKFAGNREKGLPRIQKFQNKLRVFKGGSELDAVVKDIDGVDASKFVPELADAIMEAAGVSAKLKELFAVVNVCSRLNGTYEDFRGMLSKSLDKAFSSSSSDLNRRRFLVRLCAELCLVECIPAATSPFLKMVQELSDTSLSDEQITVNFTVIASLVQKHAVSCLNILPDKQDSFEELLDKPWVTRNCKLSRELQTKSMQLITGAYKKSANGLLQRAYNELRQHEKGNGKVKAAGAENDQKHQQLKDNFEKLQSNLTIVSEYLNQDLPEPPEEDDNAGRVESKSCQVHAPKKKKEPKPEEALVAEDEVDLKEVSDNCRQQDSYQDIAQLKDSNGLRVGALGSKDDELEVKLSRKQQKKETIAKKAAAEPNDDEDLMRMMIMRAQRKEDEATQLAQKRRGERGDTIVGAPDPPPAVEEEVVSAHNTQPPSEDHDDNNAADMRSDADRYLSSLSVGGAPTILSPRDALEKVLASYDVEGDNFDVLVDMVTDASAEHSGVDARQLAACLQESLEPFMIAFGCDIDRVELDCLKISVSIRGIQGIQEAQSKPSEPVGQGDCSEPTPAKPAQKAGISRAAAICAKNVQHLVSGYPKEDDTASSIAPVENVANGKAKSRGPALDSHGNTISKYADSDEPTRISASETKKVQRETQRSLRIERAEAKVNRPQVEDLADIAANGLQETQQALSSASANSHSKVARGVHVEGLNSRNIHLEDVSITITGDQGSLEILKGSDLHMSAGHIYGLVGRNGSGKTTLLRRLGARAIPGMPAHFRFGYVAQELAALQSGQSPIEAVVNADLERRALLNEREELEALLDGSDSLRDPKAIAAAEAHALRFIEVEQQLESIEADGAEDRAREMLAVLDFKEGVMQQPMDTLSGGWRMRVALACALSSRNDVLLLDEPTNHLDLHGVLWLQNHLRREWGEGSKKKDRIVVIVSHDRAFLDNCATDILEIDKCKLRTFTGNYSMYLDRVAEEQRCLLLRKAEVERQDKVAVKELKAMKKAARDHKDEKKVRQLKSKEKKLDNEKRLCSAREFGGDAEEITTKLREDPSLRFRFPDVAATWDADENFLEVDNACVKQGGKDILRKVTLTLQPGSRVAIVGANGSGKSTLMQALAGELKFEEGSRGRGRKHPAFKPGFVAQNHLESQAGGLNWNCVKYLREQLPSGENLRGGEHLLTQKSDDSVLRALLGNFGMGNDALKKVGYLSGGQKARLSLAASTWWSPNTLLLDEPTNHLDIDSLDALSIGLQGYEGAVIVVSHNQGFLEALCDELWIVEGGTVKVCPKGDEAFADYFAKYVKEVKKSLKN